MDKLVEQKKKTRKLWTDEEVDYLEWYVRSGEEKNLNHAIEYLGRSRNAVRSKLAKLQKYDKSVKFWDKWSAKEDDYLRMYYQYYQYKTLARNLGRSEKSVRERVQTLGLRKISDLSRYVADVQALAEKGWSRDKIRFELGLKRWQIDYIVRKYDIQTIILPLRNDTKKHAWRGANDIVFRKVVENNGNEGNETKISNIVERVSRRNDKKIF